MSPAVRRGAWAALALVVALASAGCGGDAGDGRGGTLAVAASMRHVMPALLAAWATGEDRSAFAITYGGSGTLARQVAAGAPVDGVIFASARHVDELIDEGIIEAGSRRVLATNALVLVGPADAPPRTFEKLGDLPDGARLAVGDPDVVPAGTYARDALRALGVWEALQDKLVFAMDVSGVLAYVRRGEVAAGIVYRTETRGVPDVAVLDEARAPWAPRPQVVGGVVRGSAHAATAAAFLAFVASKEGEAVLAAHGFSPR